jgi:hypothetical protein
MARDAAAEAGVLDLLRVYRDFYPEIVIDQPLYRRRGAGFKVRCSHFQCPHTDQRSFLTLNGRNACGSSKHGMLARAM